MKEALKIAIIKLLSVKSLVTLILTVGFAILSIKGVINGDQFLTVFTVVISFYFGTQFQKNEINQSKTNESEKE